MTVLLKPELPLWSGVECNLGVVPNIYVVPSGLDTTAITPFLYSVRLSDTLLAES